MRPLADFGTRSGSMGFLPIPRVFPIMKRRSFGFLSASALSAPANSCQRAPMLIQESSSNLNRYFGVFWNDQEVMD